MGDMGENFGDWGDRGENGVRVGRNGARILTQITPFLRTFPFSPDLVP
jgi:hypothetical protein